MELVALRFMVSLPCSLFMSFIKGCFAALTEVTYGIIIHLGILSRKLL